MRIRTDDEVYRVDAVWLGPPKATFPWRARYVAWGVGVPTFLLVMTVERQLGFGFGFFSTAWALVITIALTRLICSRISHERPLSAVFVMWFRELTTPRERTSGSGGAASATGVRVRADRPRPRQHRSARRRPSRAEQLHHPSDNHPDNHPVKHTPDEHRPDEHRPDEHRPDEYGGGERVTTNQEGR